MQCPNCHHPLDLGATFCGNCGHPVPSAPQPSTPVAAPAVPITPPIQAPQPPIAPAPSIVPAQTLTPVAVPAQQVSQQPIPVPQPQQVPPSVPAYATPPITPTHHTKGVLSVVFGAISIVFCLIPIASIVLGIAGIILGTLSPKQAGKGLKITGIVLSSVGILFGLAAWGIFIAASPEIKKLQAESKKLNQPAITQTTNDPSQPATGATVKTGTAAVDNACYSIAFSKTMTINKNTTGCNSEMYSGSSISTTAEAYTVVSIAEPSITADNFSAIKDALSYTMSQAMPGYTVTGQHADTFKGEPAYYMTLTKDGTNLSAEEATVLHKSPQGDNIFIIAHAGSGNVSDLKELESGWNWK